MPSLRRTASSPIVRSSPYSSGPLSSRGSGHRRSSGSETSNRRVLADIEWWRVTDGQRESSPDQESEDRNRGNADVVALDVSLGAGAGIHITHVVDPAHDPLEPLPLPWPPAPPVVSDEVCTLFLPFAPALLADSHPVVVELKLHCDLSDSGECSAYRTVLGSLHHPTHADSPAPLSRVVDLLAGVDARGP